MARCFGKFGVQQRFQDIPIDIFLNFDKWRLLVLLDLRRRVLLSIVLPLLLHIRITALVKDPNKLSVKLLIPDENTMSDWLSFSFERSFTVPSHCCRRETVIFGFFPSERRNQIKIKFTQSRHMTTMKRRTLSFLLIGAGSVLLLLGICIQLLMPIVVDRQVTDQVVISSAEHAEFEHQFITNNLTDSPPKYNKLFFFHITNLQEFLYEGQAPVYREQGPYVFREIYMRHNIKFSDNQELVSYSEAIQNQFIPEMSIGSLDDEISIINLPYVKVMSKFGRESLLVTAAGTRVLPVALTQMQNLMVPAIVNGATAQAIQKIMGIFAPLNFGRKRLLSKMSGNCDGLTCINAAPGLGSYRDLLNTGICYCKKCECSDKMISPEMMERLFDPTDEYGILNANQDVGINYWLSFFSNNQTTVETLKARFQLTDYQVTKLHNWLVTVTKSDIISSAVFKELNGRSVPTEDRVSSWNDIPYRQMLHADVLSLLLNKTSEPSSVQPNAPPEIPFFLQWAQEQNGTIYANFTDIETAVNQWNIGTMSCIAEVLNGDVNMGIFDLTGMKAYRPGKAEDFVRMSLDNVPTNSTWETCFSNGGVDLNMKILKSYVNYAAKNVLYGQFRDVTQMNGGLVVTRTVRQHALGNVEPLLRIVLEPSDPRYRSHQILVNDESLESETLCRSTADINNDYTSCLQVRISDATETITKKYYRAPSTYYTGVNHVDRVGQLARLNGNSSFTAVFVGGNLKIDGGAQNIPGSIQYGYSNGLSFPPLNSVNQDTVLAMYDPSITVPLLFEYVTDINDLYGIKLKRFAIRPNQFTRQRSDANLYDMQKNISPAGLLNVTEPKGFSVYVSTPHFYGYNNTLPLSYSMETNSTKFSPVISNSSAEYQKYWSFLDVEPITGKTMRGIVRGQVVTSFSETDFDLFYPDAYKADYLPVYWKEVYGEISEPLADTFKVVYTAQYYSQIFFFLGVLMGLCFLTSGLLTLFYPRLTNKSY